MIPLIFESFRIIYFITGAKRFAYFFAIFFIAVLNFIIFKGICALAAPVFGPLDQVGKLFRGIMQIPTFAVLCIINWRVVPFQMMDFAASMKTKYFKLLIYLVLAALLFGYDRFIARYF